MIGRDFKAKEPRPDGLDLGLKCCGLLALIPVLWGVSVVLDGLALEWLWNHYVTPMGAPQMPFVSAMGVSLIVAMLAHQLYPTPRDDSEQAKWGRFAGSLARPLLTWFVGWCVWVISGGV